MMRPSYALILDMIADLYNAALKRAEDREFNRQPKDEPCDPTTNTPDASPRPESQSSVREINEELQRERAKTRPGPR